MEVIAHTESSQAWQWLIEPWEIHPVVNHFAIAFLIAAVVLDLYAWGRGRPTLAQTATGLLVAGFLTGLVTALAGVLAFFTVPAHTAEAHDLMWYHIGFQVAAMILFAVPTWRRWRNWSARPATVGRIITLLAALLLLVGSGIGGYLVYHGGAGIEEDLLAPSVRESHEHGGHDEHPAGGDHHRARTAVNESATCFLGGTLVASLGATRGGVCSHMDSKFATRRKPDVASICHVVLGSRRNWPICRPTGSCRRQNS